MDCGTRRVYQEYSEDTIKDDKCSSFTIIDEDDTLGNSLKNILLKHPDVIFCGYCIPHPSESKITFRVQTNSLSAVQVFKEGVAMLHDISNVAIQKLDEAIKGYQSNSNNTQ